jgi:wyosine [tRNA(Phe)-imidazoG37] synthetase (radical SAM superfamily)
LGVDLLPYKTCSLDCVYCECGATTHLTTQRSEFVPADQVIDELDRFLASKPDLDFVTFSGSGEPTLHAGLGKVIAHLKAHHPGYRVAVLTNGTLFSQAEARTSVLAADLLIPSLDAATPEAFRAINRPAPEIVVDKVIEGLVVLRSQYSGTFILEIFVVPGVNDTKLEIAALRAAAERIGPDAIQLNRLDRPGTDRSAQAASDEILSSFAQALSPRPVFVVPSRDPGSVRRVDDRLVEQSVLDRAGEGEVDVTTLALLLGLQEGVVAKSVNELLEDGRLVRIQTPSDTRVLVRLSEALTGSV